MGTMLDQVVVDKEATRQDGNVQVGQIFSLSNPLKLSSDQFPSWLCRARGINKDPAIWLDRA
jgi:hypothetical protein